MNFLWRGHKDAKSGHCLLAWPKVCRPVELGGLGISNLQNLNWALWMRWIWAFGCKRLRLTDLGPPSQFKFMAVCGPFFSMALVSEIGNGTSALFWTDGCTDNVLLILHPRCFHLCQKGRANKRTVQKAFTNYCWVSDIKGALSVEVIVEYLGL
jgi:hypothetical protein